MVTESLERQTHGLWQARLARCGTAVVVLMTALLAGATGDLDATFARGGLLTFSIGGFGSCSTDLLQQPSGKLVFAGWGVHAGDSQDFVVTRYDAAGRRDTTFGDDGLALSDFNGLDDYAYAVIQQADAKLVLAGIVRMSASTTDIGLARFTSDGTADSRFGTGGRVRINAGGDDDEAHELVQQADGKLVLAGATDASGRSQMLLARVSADGRLDTSFGSDGFVVLDFGANTTSAANAMLQQADGKLVVVGYVIDASGDNFDFAVARLTVDGQLDATFDGDGLLTIDIGGTDSAMSVVLQSDGRIVLGGYTTTDDKILAAIVRLETDGRVDPGFGPRIDQAPLLASLVVEPDDSLLALANDATDLMVVRLRADGTFDANYGTDGRAIVDFGIRDIPPLAYGNALLRQADGRHVLVACDDLGEFAVARIDDAGTSPGRVGLEVTDQFVFEETGAASYIVRRTGGTAGTASVDYATTAGSADAGTDFTPTSGTLTWADGDGGAQTVTVPIVDDSVSESREDFKFALSNPSGAALAASVANTTIGSADGPGEFTFFDGLTPIQIPESHHTYTIGVRRINGSEGAVTVDYRTHGSTATPGQDFTGLSGTLSWADGDTQSKTIQLEILDDDIAEGAEDFNIQLSNPTGGAEVHMLADMQLVRILASDTGEGPGVLAFSSSAVPLMAEGSSLTLRVARTDGATGTVTVDFSTSAGSASPGSDYQTTQGTLTWQDGDISEKSITIHSLKDDRAEDEEEFRVSLSNPGGGAALGSDSTRMVMIGDDAGDDGTDGGGGHGGGGGGDGRDLALLALLILARQILRPPSAMYTPPVEKLLRFDARNSAVPAISSARACRRSGIMPLIITVASMPIAADRLSSMFF
jgi:uncharacterized delta-60 repeat protein